MPTITISFTAAQGARLAKAFGAELRLGGNANDEQYRQALIEYTKSVVLRQERIAKKKALRDEYAAIEPIDLT